MRNNRLLCSLIIIIIVIFLLYIINNYQYSLCEQSIINSTLFFRITFDQLMNLLKIPEMADPKKRMETMKPFDFQISKRERQTFLKLINLFDNLMKEHGIIYFIIGGTLLGSYRCHDFLPWDDDLDLYIDLSQRKKLEELFQSLNLTNVRFFIGGTHDKLYFENDSFQSSPFEWKWPYIDISFYDSNATHIFDITTVYGKVDTFPKSVVFPLTVRPFSIFDLPSPKDAFAVLVWNFGYTDECVMNQYSHILETTIPREERIKCKNLLDKFPYVKRYNFTKDIIEELIYQDNILQRIKVNEPLYGVTESFVLDIKQGYSYPSDVDLPDK